MLVYLARHLLPVVSPPIADGAIAVEQGRITAVGRREELLEAMGDDVEIRDLGHVVALPGLINAHTHLELSWLGEQPPSGGHYMTWLRELLDRIGDEDEASGRSGAERALDDLVTRGTVAIGDVSNRSWVVPLIARSPLHGIAFHEILGFNSDDAERLLEQLAQPLGRVVLDLTRLPLVADAVGRVGPHKIGMVILQQARIALGRA